MTKKELRKLFLERRKALSEASCVSLNLAIYSTFFTAIDLSFIKVVHTYLPMANTREPDTWAILDRIRREFPHIRICLPRVAGDELEHIFYEGPQQLQASAWGIPEPRQGVPVALQKIDLVIVPLLAVDRNGHRVGYGRGFYDRMLNSVRPDCRKIGLSFFEPVQAIDDVDQHDVPLNACITPGGFTAFT